MNRIVRVVSANDDGRRLSDFLLRRMQLSKHFLARVKQVHDGILVNGIRRRVDWHISCGDTISVDTSAGKMSTLVSEQTALSVVYEDDMVVVIDKPAGMAMYPHHPGQTGSLAAAILGHLQEAGEQKNCHLLTRLDIGTSGLVLVAKNSYAAEYLQRTGVTKAYQCIVYGRLAQTCYLTLPISRASSSLQRLGIVMSVAEEGKLSHTYIKPLLYDELYGFTYVRVITGSGRRHQIRVHLSHVGHPLLGDGTYGGPSLSEPWPLLHAAAIRYHHPENNHIFTHYSSFVRMISEPVDWSVFSDTADLFER